MIAFETFIQIIEMYWRFGLHFIGSWKKDNFFGHMLNIRI